jgi:hypothetical protein
VTEQPQQHYISQGYPLWAVRAVSEGDGETDVGFVIGWEGNDEESARHPIVATLGNSNRAFRGSAYTWMAEVVTSEKPGARWVEWVEIYPTYEQAQERAPHLLREVCAHHGHLWPEDMLPEPERRPR